MSGMTKTDEWTIANSKEIRKEPGFRWTTQGQSALRSFEIKARLDEIDRIGVHRHGYGKCPVCERTTELRAELEEVMLSAAS